MGRLKGARGEWLESDDDKLRCLVSEVFRAPGGPVGREMEEAGLGGHPLSKGGVGTGGSTDPGEDKEWCGPRS